ncbi:hypothetical protein [Proteus myxofaciens]|uniref:Uncharacterized protein n=1 Tax=Proteus myxofaciens ATCC 19692 TaxID=1354337 RepID=A0A198FRP5_9GAMM|nr:hypothetical protein [Proteus myxofaciens]OAT27139.1 hypothetical protein M983_1957 [Proteus myxofaciens ATCC 19692]
MKETKHYIINEMSSFKSPYYADITSENHLIDSIKNKNLIVPNILGE